MVRLMVDGWWLMVDGWWLMVDGWWPVPSRCDGPFHQDVMARSIKMEDIVAAEGLESEPHAEYDSLDPMSWKRATIDHFPIHRSRRPTINTHASNHSVPISRPSKTEWFDACVLSLHCRLTGSKAASDRMVWCNGGCCKQWYYDTCTPACGTVETVKKLHYPGLLH